jgi:maltose/moltooligosaccharide transporter
MNWHGFNSLGFALFSQVWDYTTLAVTQHIYNTTDTLRLQYRRQVGEMFANYNLIAAIAAFTPCTAKHTSRKFHLLR